MSDSRRMIGPERDREREREEGEIFRRVENMSVYRCAKSTIFIKFCQDDGWLHITCGTVRNEEYRPAYIEGFSRKNRRQESTWEYDA
jgi:hypothetical protein